MSEKNGQFEPLDKDTPLPEKEKETIEFWEENDIAERTRNREREKKFGFTEGPPTANGLPHIGHVRTRVVKDVYLRYKTMKGYQVVPNIAGWDTHGLPVEIEVEKELGIDSKEEIEDYGLEKFNEMCKESVFKYEKEWKEMSKRIGFWINYEDAYITMEDDYIESVWWSLKQHWENGLLEKGHMVVPYCPRCGTPLSSHEVAQGYRMTEDPSIHMRFKVKDEDAYFLAWTTTPWTLISNLLLAVDEDIDYALIEYEGDKYYLAEDLVEEIFDDVEILDTMKGEELIGKEYEPMFDYVDSDSESHYVTHADFVTLEEGTGIVHVAPAFGEDDYDICQDEGVDLVNPVDEAGKFTETVEDYAGQFVKDADDQIMDDLEERGDLLSRGTTEHRYMFCWRCDSPLLNYALESWFIRTSWEKEKLIDNNEEIFWKPEHLKNGRFGNFLDELKDWSLSRNRFWGTPLPIWTCDNGHEVCVGSKEELEKKATEALSDNFEFHRPYVDRVELECPDCEEKMERVPYVIDCWYDSGSAPFAQFHYPFENEEKFEEAFPVDFITESLDQTRGWFYSLLAISSLLRDEPAYMKCLTQGLILDEDGEKMSKSKGNAVDPTEVMQEKGADATRLYFMTSPVWNSTKFSKELVDEKINKTINTLMNVVSFFTNNANIDGFEPSDYEVNDEIDRWLLSRKNSLIKEVEDGFDDLELHNSARSIEAFIDDLSNWYLRRSRRRFWEGTEEEKMSAYNTLYETLKTLVKVMSPFTPFLAERIYRKLIYPNEEGFESVHMCGFPPVDEKQLDTKLEENMELVIDIAELGRNARQKQDIKLRQPLKKAIVVSEDEQMDEAVKTFEDILMEELNVKELTTMQGESSLTETKVDPNYSSIGPKFKGDAEKVAQVIETSAPEKVKDEIEKNGEVELDGFTIEEEDLEIYEEVKEKYTYSGERDLKVFVDTEMDEELETEGTARDVVRRIQTMRKELELGYTQKIKTYFEGDDDLVNAVKEMEDYIKKETLSRELTEGSESFEEGLKKDWSIEGNEITIWVDPIEGSENESLNT
ncbi:MAG: isoleucine--tRNA ligase [Candidatus Thermoplasmatota archaeon]